MIGWITAAPPDRPRRGYAGALCEFSCSHEFAALPQPATGEPCRYATSKGPRIIQEQHA